MRGVGDASGIAVLTIFLVKIESNSVSTLELCLYSGTSR